MTAQAPVTSDPAFGTRPSTPYRGTTGHAAGPGPSAERAHREAHDGTAADRQARIIALLSDAGPNGYTADELQRRGIAPHRSAVSAHTSVLHKEGRIACLAERRDGAGIYVLPQHVNGRRTRAFAGRKGTEVQGGEVTSLRDATDRLAEAQAEIERLQRVLTVSGVVDDGMQFANGSPEAEASTALVQSVADQGRNLATARAEIDRLREQNGEQAAEIERLNAQVHRPRLTDQERTLVDNIENGLPRLKDKGVVSLRWVSAKTVVDAIRRLDGE